MWSGTWISYSWHEADAATAKPLVLWICMVLGSPPAEGLIGTGLDLRLQGGSCAIAGLEVLCLSLLQGTRFRRNCWPQLMQPCNITLSPIQCNS